MAPVGSFASLVAAIEAGADAVYFGVEQLNMRAHSANHFSISDLHTSVEQAYQHGVKTYITVNTIIYDEELSQMQAICDAAKQAGVSAIIASDVSVLLYCRSIGIEVHLSTQLNISNSESLRFYAQFADVVVLARELNLAQVERIHQFIDENHICGPSGSPLRIEMFCHGALCMAVSGKCYLSLDNLGHSANRGECLQVCRRGYAVRDVETGMELDIQNKYIMSPKDLKTIGFIDRMMKAGVKVFKIEGRARSAEYVSTVVSCYKEAISAVCEGTYTAERIEEWNTRLSTVFNRGFWDGYYLGQRLGEWSNVYGSQATEKKVYVGRGVKYFSRLGVGEFKIEAASINKGDELLIIGPTVGARRFKAEDIFYNDQSVDVAKQGWSVSMIVPDKVRSSDKLYKIVKNQQ